VTRYKHTETGEIKNHRDWQNELGMSFHADRLPQFLTVHEYSAPALTLEQRREIKRIELKQRRIEIVSAPINNIQVAAVEDRDNIEWAAANAAMPVQWIMADNTVQMLNADDFSAVIAEYPARKQAAFTVYADLLVQLQNSTEPELIEWPEVL